MHVMHVSTTKPHCYVSISSAPLEQVLKQQGQQATCELQTLVACKQCGAEVDNLDRYTSCTGQHSSAPHN